MTTQNWLSEQALLLLNKWYACADKSTGLIDKYPVTHKLLQKQRVKQNNDCKRNALHCKTAGLVWHDRYKLALDVSRGIY